MHRQTKFTAISKSVKERVWRRDSGCCIYCGNPNAAPNAHYIPRSRGGLGIEENIVTLCAECHRDYDQSGERKVVGAYIRGYLKAQYAEWDEKKLVYRRS